MTYTPSFGTPMPHATPSEPSRFRRPDRGARSAAGFLPRHRHVHHPDRPYPGQFLEQLDPARFGWSDATEVFVFCSGMASAIAFGRVFAKRGLALGTVRVGFRVWQVYWAHIGLFFAVAMTMALLNATGWFEKNYIASLNLTHFFKNNRREPYRFDDPDLRTELL